MTKTIMDTKDSSTKTPYYQTTRIIKGINNSTSTIPLTSSRNKTTRRRAHHHRRRVVVQKATVTTEILEILQKGDTDEEYDVGVVKEEIDRMITTTTDNSDSKNSREKSSSNLKQQQRSFKTEQVVDIENEEECEAHNNNGQKIIDEKNKNNDCCYTAHNSSSTVKRGMVRDSRLSDILLKEAAFSGPPSADEEYDTGVVKEEIKCMIAIDDCDSNVGERSSNNIRQARYIAIEEEYKAYTNSQTIDKGENDNCCVTPHNSTTIERGMVGETSEIEHSKASAEAVHRSIMPLYDATRIKNSSTESSPFSIDPKIAARIDPRWMTRFYDLIAYKVEFGNCDVPHFYPANMKLGRWVNTQRQVRKGMKQGKMCIDRRQLLTEIGFTWDLYEAEWQKHFEELKAYKEDFGDCNVPIGFPKNKELGEWAHTQRVVFKGGRKRNISKCRIHQLESIDFKWN